jgi:hypothetical protein
MTPATTFSGRRVALFGLGGSGLATARALVEGGAEVTAWDDNPDSVARARDEGVPVADLSQADWSGFASFVLSPGVPLTHPAPHWSVLMARQAGIEVIGDIELFCRERRRHLVERPAHGRTRHLGRGRAIPRHGVACPSWIQHPEPTGSGEQRPPQICNIRRDIPQPHGPDGDAGGRLLQ